MRPMNPRPSPHKNTVMSKTNTNSGRGTCTAVFVLIITPVFVSTLLLARNTIAFFTLNFISGLLCWTYLEYYLHRFWTHNKYADSSKKAFKRHVHHHKHPTEIKVTALQRTILFITSAVIFSIALVWNNYFTIATGFAIGFAYSFFSHWLLHQTWSQRLFPRLHRFHIHHHCKYPDRCFGFSTIFWDVVFGTVPPKNAVLSKKTIQFYYGTHH